MGRLGLRMRAYCCSQPVLLQITKTDLYFLRHGKKGNDQNDVLILHHLYAHHDDGNFNRIT